MSLERFKELSLKIGKKIATEEEKNEYMTYLFQNGKLTEKQYEDYNSGKRRSDLLDFALFAGALLFLGWMLKKVTEN